MTSPARIMPITGGTKGTLAVGGRSPPGAAPPRGSSLENTTLKDQTPHVRTTRRIHRQRGHPAVS